jgi:hypothetical protein
VTELLLMLVLLLARPCYGDDWSACGYDEPSTCEVKQTMCLERE